MSFKSGQHFKWELLHSIEYQNDIAFNAFRKIIENQEQVYSLNNNELTEIIEGDQILNSLPQNHYGSYLWTNYAVEIYTVEEVKHFQRYSSCIILFSFFEEKLKAICDLVATEYGFEKVKRPKSEYVKSYCHYLTDICGIDKSINIYLEAIIEQIFVRNKIVHQGGFFTESQFKGFFSTSGISLEKYNNEYQIIINNIIYLIGIIEKMNTFLKYLLLEVDKRYQKIT